MNLHGLSRQELVQGEWPVCFADAYRIRDSRLEVSDSGRVRLYQAAGNLQMTLDLAYMPQTEAGVLEFAKTWGEIRASWPSQSDPLTLIWDHSKALRMTFEFIREMKTGNLAVMESKLREYGWPGGRSPFEFTFPVGAEYRPAKVLPVEDRIRAGKGRIPLVEHLLEQTVKLSINAQVRSMHPFVIELPATEPGSGLVPTLINRNLVDVSYWNLLGQLQGGDNFINCQSESCGRLLVRQDARQKYCPSTEAGKESACSLRERMKKYRAGLASNRGREKK